MNFARFGIILSLGVAPGLFFSPPRSALGETRVDAGKEEQCLVCHRDLEALPKDFSKEDVHMLAGLSCTGCHEGDPHTDDADEAKASKTGFVGSPARRNVPAFCGKCHSDITYMREYQPRIPTDQEHQYFTSVHGLRLKEGDKKVATCTGCHTAHGILRVSDSRSSVYPLNVPFTCKKCHADPEYMKEYGIRIDQFDKFAQSVHGIALLEKNDTGAPACNDCHGNHGAMPPGVTSVTQVCGHCHVNNLQFFSATTMAKKFEEQKLHGCEECHGNHLVRKTTDDMVGTGENSVCMDCHEAGDKGFESAEAIHTELINLVAAYDGAVEKQKIVQRIGMDDVEIGYLLQEAHQDLIQARTLVHTFDPIKVGAKTREGLMKADSATALGIGQIRDYQIRRRGFGMATIFITLLVVALFLKVREMEGK